MFNCMFIVMCNMPLNMIVIHRNELVTNAANNKLGSSVRAYSNAFCNVLGASCNCFTILSAVVVLLMLATKGYVLMGSVFS